MNENVILNLGGSGGAALNFKVVGNPQPAAPGENTIWLNTDVPIGAWYFSATQPENLNEGDVWFPTGISSSVEFNALKKNGIQVYPLSAKQYVGGALVDVEAKSYQNGEWVDWWNGELYDAGNEYEVITGGWTGYKMTSSTSKGTITKGVDSITLTAGINQSIEVAPNNEVDFTRYSKVSITVTARTGGNDRVYMVIRTNRGDNVGDTGAVAFLALTKTGTHTLELPSGLEKGYVAVRAFSTENPTSSITFTNARLME